ncbi:MAG: 3'-5' exonuclease [Bacteroidales bacterium]
MRDKSYFENIFFLDIETVPLCASFEELSSDYAELWDKKSKFWRKAEETAADTYQRAGIYAEFGRIVCISVGYIDSKEEGYFLRIKSFDHEDEKVLLANFAITLNAFYKVRPNMQLCAHNGKEFDFPFIGRRMLIHGVELPNSLNVQSKKPWETPFVDTMELWKFGDYKHFTSLNLLARIFDIPTPKDDIDGSQVAEVYYVEKNLGRIVQYCEKDVLTLARVFLRLQGSSQTIHEVERV